VIFGCCLHVGERLLEGAHEALQNLPVLSSWLETSIDVFFTLYISFSPWSLDYYAFGEMRMQREREKTEVMSLNVYD
jgi:hypothetical protein